MSQGANVEDLDIFRSMKLGLVKFRSMVETALINADSQSSRVMHWLEGEQLSFWSTQIRKRQEHITRCREAVRAKTMFKDSTGRTPSAFEEEKALRAALIALEVAEMKLAATKRAIPQLQKELETYRGAAQAIGTAMVSEVPKALAMLERLSLTLQDYINLASPGATGSDAPGATTSIAQQAMHRAGESAESAAPLREAPDGGDDVTG